MQNKAEKIKNYELKGLQKYFKNQQRQANERKYS